MDSSDPAGGSPFHEGEQAIQSRLGIRDKVEAFGRRVIRDHLPDQHQDFYAKLPLVLLGTVDDRGRPWASVVPGRPGFMSCPDPRTLRIAARPLFGDPLNETLKPGAAVGLLGIEPATRRRNRLTGRVAAAGPDGVSIAVVQAFGNCPQYIQTREIHVLPGIDTPAQPRPLRRGDRFDAATRALIEQADTLFLASAWTDGRDAPSRGADVSHRGGKPGFVRTQDDRTFVFPDFAGNDHFNTVGNLTLNPRCGFLFIDFASGDLAWMTGTAEIVWDGEMLKAFTGAERLIRFRLEALVRAEGSLPLRFSFGEYSPLLDHTGSWAEADATLAADRDRNDYRTFEVVAIHPQSTAVTSFHLHRADGGGLASYEPGQFLPIRVTVPGRAEPQRRTYTISDAPGGDHYRLSIKREDDRAGVSAWFHDQVRVGDRIEAMAPRGSFVLDRASTRPVVLLSAGVGITPMIAIANAIIIEGLRTRRFRRTYFIHGARNGRVLAFGEHIRALAARHENFHAHIRFSHPDPDDRLGESHDSVGHVDIDLLRQVLPFDDFDFYLCGPAPFMQALYRGLTGLGVRDERIRYESFGPATVLKGEARAAGGPAPTPTAAKEPVLVRFAASEMEVEWTPASGTLLELAEAAGLSPAFSCRSGICGTCATKIRCGAVDYLDAPSADIADDEVLLCCATPRSASRAGTCGDRFGVVLEA